MISVTEISLHTTTPISSLHQMHFHLMFVHELLIITHCSFFNNFREDT